MEGNSVVYVLGESTSDCGYCGARRSSDGKGARRKSGSARSETSVSYGMHAEVLSVQTYQELLDRGWRRSGKWLYKPVLAKTCCQLQTIRLEVDKYESSASQRRVRKRWERYLSAGDQGQGVVGEHLGGGSECEDGVGEGKCTGCVYDEHRMEKSVAGSDGTSSDGTDRLSVDMVDLVEEDFEGDEEEEEEEEMEPKRPRSPQGEAGLEIDGKGGMELLPDGKSSVPTTPNGTLVDCKGKGYKWKRQRSQLCLGSLLDGDLTELSPSLGLKEKLRVESVSAEPIDIHDVRAAVTNALANALAIAKRESEIPDLAYPSVTLKWAKEGLKKAHGSDLVLSSSIAFAIAGNIKGWNKRNGGQAVEMTPERVATQLLKRITLEDRWGVSLRQVDGHLNVFCALSNVEKSMVRSRCANGEPLGTKKAKKPPVAPKTEHVAGKQTFRVVTVPSSHPDIPEVEFELFKKYQTIHHKDTDVSLKSFKRFLCDSPLVPVSRVESPSAPSCGYGSFHQQYWLGDRLVAVGVVDVLPKCLSSKYFFWDPSMAKLSLGTLASLLEIDWVKNEATHAPEFRYYYLGYYLHDCHRMKYKASFSPSELLCPLTYQWVPIVSIADDLDRGLPPWNMKGHVGKSMGKTRAYRNPGEDGEAMEDLNETEEIDDVNLAITFPDSQRQAWKVMPFRVVRQLGLIRSGAEELSRAIRRWMDMVGPVCSNMLYAV
mmetsp:Transcript_11909/g.33562  ORF Transcript_11909/g.33562 Transcript_11909/m.33562 type:complete len:713 (-) Transcript_11909:116-2254(-)